MSDDAAEKYGASEDDLFGESDDQTNLDVDQTMDSDEGSEASLRPKKKAKAEIQRIPQSYDRASSDFSLARVPGFLMVDPKPLDTEEFLAQEPNDTGAFLAENTLRWRFARSEDGLEMVKESNARLVEWDDGSLTLQLGSEQFEIKTQTNSEPIFVATRFTNDNIYQTRHLVNKALTIMPTSTSSRTHQRLAAILSAKHERQKSAIGSVATYVDPEKVQRDLEKAQSMKDKARRKLETDRDRVTTSYRRTTRDFDDFSDDDNIHSISRDGARSSKRGHDDDESDGDDFGSSAQEEEEHDSAEHTDDDDLDIQAQRLQAAKQGSVGLSKRADEETDDEQPRPIRRTTALDDDSD